MEFIDKPTAQLLAELLAAAGVRHVVVSQARVARHWFWFFPAAAIST